MKTSGRYVRAGYEDKIVFTPKKKAQRQRNVLTVWQQTQGLWKDHPVFHGMAAKEIIEWLRGEDSDV